MSTRRDVNACAALVVIVLALVAWPIASGALGQKAFDHRFYHLPLVREWAATWPIADVRDYNSATGPLYHWVMAGVARVLGPGTAPETAPQLQFANALFAALLVLVVYRFARRCVSALPAFLAALALACSPYVLGDAIWLMTDNLSLALVAAAVGSATFAPRSPRRTVAEGCAAALAVATRQINVWLIAPLGLAALLRDGRRSVLATLAALALPVAMLGAFVWLWHGPVPPKFRAFHASGLQPGAIGFALTLVFAYGVCLVPLARHGLAALRSKPGLLFATLGVGALLGAIGATSVGVDLGRNGGWLWRAVENGPFAGQRSLLIVVGAALGTTLLVALFIEARRAARANEAAVLLCAFAAFLAAHVANAQVFQRYYDPTILLTLVWLAALGVPREEPPRRATTLAFGLLAVQQALFAALALYLPMVRGG